MLSFGVCAWTGGAGLWNIPKGAVTGIGNFITKFLLNNILGNGTKLVVDSVYAMILGEECGWINVLKAIIEWIF